MFSPGAIAAVVMDLHIPMANARALACCHDGWPRPPDLMITSVSPQELGSTPTT